MKAKTIKWLLAACCGLLAACAIITVNVYFPEKAAKEAYKSLDDMLLKNNDDKAPGTEKKSAPEPGTPTAGPQSMRFHTAPIFALVAEAQAAESEADTLAIEMASMPEVIKAYDEMSRRLPRIEQLFNSGAIGLTSQALVTVRDKSKVTPQDEGLLNAENRDRKTIVTSMAKAIVKLDGQKETKAALDQVMGKAAATYAETKREAAKPGWWMQLQNGRWVQK